MVQSVDAIIFNLVNFILFNGQHLLYNYGHTWIGRVMGKLQDR